MAVQKQFTGTLRYGDPALTGGVSVHDKQFDELFAYDGPLGLGIGDEQITFHLWAPTAEEAYVNLYADAQTDVCTRHAMTRGERGSWSFEGTEALLEQYYTFSVVIEGEETEAVDPYARLVGVNGDRGFIGRLNHTNPEGFDAKTKPAFVNPTDAIVYEVHVRDFSIQPQSPFVNKGKFLAFTEQAGLDYLTNLGVTHVQLLPVYDYSTDSVDETRLSEEQYNWGYDPKNYNAIEGSYATDPYDPYVRVRELKQAIQAMHGRGLRVIMDVVYNHVYDAYRMNFMKLVPGYYYRYENGVLANGSGCGNDTASERYMMRRFIVDSIRYLATEFGFDGFRFDLMGLHDTETMNEVRRVLDEIDPTILVIGEGWHLNTPMDAEAANQSNAVLMPRIAHFNDGIRDGLRGSAIEFEKTGWVNGHKRIEDVRVGVVGSIQYDEHIKGFAVEPDQCVTYIEAHDNHTVWDKLIVSNPKASDEERTKMHRLASAVMMTSQGIAFVHAGQEFMRTKGGVENSYKSPTPVNQMDWVRVEERAEDVTYMKELIRLRKRYDVFRMTSAEQIRNGLTFMKSPKHSLAYTLEGADERVYVIHNANKTMRTFHLPKEAWTIVFGEAQIKERAHDMEVRVDGMTTLVLEGVKES